MWLHVGYVVPTDGNLTFKTWTEKLTFENLTIVNVLPCPPMTCINTRISCNHDDEAILPRDLMPSLTPSTNLFSGSISIKHEHQKYLKESYISCHYHRFHSTSFKKTVRFLCYCSSCSLFLFRRECGHTRRVVICEEKMDTGILEKR